MSESRIPIPSYFLPFFAFLAAIVPFAIDAYLPAFPSIAAEFEVSEAAIGQTISFFFLGYGIGQFFGGPLSDQVGRKPIALIGMGLFMLATLGIIFSHSLAVIKCLRFLQALGGGFSTVIVLASIRDAYPAHEAGRKYSVAMMIMLIMPIIAPIIGSFLIPYGWRSIFVASFIFVLIAFITYLFGLKETAQHIKGKVDVKAMFRQFREVIAVRNEEGMRAIMYVFAVSFTVGILLSFVTNSSAIYQGIFGVSEQVFPYFFGSNVLLMICCIFYSVRRMKTVHPHTLFMTGNHINLVCTALLLIYVVFFQPQLSITAALIILSVGTLGLINPCAAAVYISYFDELSGSATSFNRLLVLFAGGFTGALVGYFDNGSMLPFALVVFLCSVGSNIIAWSMPKPQNSFHKK